MWSDLLLGESFRLFRLPVLAAGFLHRGVDRSSGRLRRGVVLPRWWDEQGISGLRAFGRRLLARTAARLLLVGSGNVLEGLEIRQFCGVLGQRSFADKFEAESGSLPAIAQDEASSAQRARYLDLSLAPTKS